VLTSLAATYYRSVAGLYAGDVKTARNEWALHLFQEALAVFDPR
jgi:hypothetical protein